MQKKSKDERSLDSDTTGENAILKRHQLGLVDNHSVENGQQQNAWAYLNFLWTAAQGASYSLITLETDVQTRPERQAEQVPAQKHKHFPLGGPRAQSMCKLLNPLGAVHRAGFPITIRRIS